MDSLDKLLISTLSQTTHAHPRKVDKPLVLYGKGELGKMAKQLFDSIGIPIAYWIDQKSLKEVPEDYKKTHLIVVCISTVPLTRISTELSFEGWTDIDHFFNVSEYYTDRHVLTNGWYAGNFSFSDRIHIEKIFNSLYDNISKAHYIEFIIWHKFRQEIPFKEYPIDITNRYFIPEILSVLKNIETVIDGGAYTGEVTKKFLPFADHIHAFEPDKYNVDILKKQINDFNVSIYDTALHETTGTFYFEHGLGYASKLSGLSSSEITTVSLDSFNFPATVIKLHLEGSELDALEGAINTIQKNRSILMITTYHNRDGLWRLPIWVLDQCKNYRILFRLHNYCGTGAVLYAIPEERYRD